LTSRKIRLLGKRERLGSNVPHDECRFELLSGEDIAVISLSLVDYDLRAARASARLVADGVSGLKRRR